MIIVITIEAEPKLTNDEEVRLSHWGFMRSFTKGVNDIRDIELSQNFGIAEEAVDMVNWLISEFDEISFKVEKK